MKTIKGVYLDLNESDIVTNYDEFRFYFSSKFNKERFEKNIDNFIKIESARIYNKYRVQIYLNLYLSIVFYKKIEKRGYRIEEILTGKRLNNSTIILNQIL